MNIQRTLPAVGHSIPLGEVLTIFKKRASRGMFLDTWRIGLRLFAVSSGSAALVVALQAFKRTASKTKVILPAYTCPSVLAAVLKAGLQPVLCDLQPGHYRMDLNSLADRDVRDALAIIAVHFFGLSEDLKALRAFADQNRIYLLEDAAQAFGNTTGQGPLGLSGDLGIYSFGRGKPLSLLSGGAVVVNNPAMETAVAEVYATLASPAGPVPWCLYAAKLVLYRVFFHPRSFWLPQCLPWLKVGETVFNAEISVQRMAVPALRLGATLVKRYVALGAMRARLVRCYSETLVGLKDHFHFLPSGDLSDPALLRFPMIFKNAACRDRALVLLKEQGLGATGSYPLPLNVLPGAADYVDNTLSYPNAHAVSERIMTLPVHEYITAADRNRMYRIIATVLREQ